MAPRTTCCYIVYGIGILLLLCGIIFGFAWPIIFNFILKEKLELSPTSATYKMWVKTPIPLYLDIYLFNWTNSEQFLQDKTVKPEFNEIGPFVFKEVHERVNITWNNNDTVTYYQRRTWNFVPEESVDLSVKITNLNVVATTITKMASRYKDIVKVIVEFLSYFYKEKLIITRSAREWLFDGMNDKLLDLIKKWTVIPIPYDKFGWFYDRNLSSTFDGKFQIRTGNNDIFNLGMLDKWNDVNKTKFYSGECGLVEGSTGELFPPLKFLQDNLTLFVTDFCGPMTLKYLNETKVKGLNGYHYVGDEQVFDNGTKYPNQKCFSSGESSPSGVRNATLCRQAPLFVSYPHFYLADPIFIDSVIGMKPNRSKHEFLLKVDSLSGIPLEVRARLQVNILLQPMKLFPLFEKVPKVYVPMMWFNQRADITEEVASQGRILRTLESSGIGMACGLALIGFSVIFIKVCIVHFCGKVPNEEKLLNSEAEKQEEEQEESSEDNS